MLLAQSLGRSVVRHCLDTLQYRSGRRLGSFSVSRMYADREPRSTRHATIEYKANAAEFGMGSRRDRTRSPATRAFANQGELCIPKCTASRAAYRTAVVSVSLNRAEGGSEIQVARRIYVGNLSYSVAWQDLKDHFKPVGEGIHGCCHSGHWQKSGYGAGRAMGFVGMLCSCARGCI